MPTFNSKHPTECELVEFEKEHTEEGTHLIPYCTYASLKNKIKLRLSRAFPCPFLMKCPYAGKKFIVHEGWVDKEIE